MADKKKSSRPAHTPPKRAKEEKSSSRGGKQGFDNTNRGALFPNDKDGNEKRPDHTGTFDIKIPDGCKPGQVVKFRVAGWERESKNGNAYLSCTIQKADKQGNIRRRDQEADEEQDEHYGED